MVREVEVRVESPQNHMAIAASSDVAAPAEGPRPCRRIAITAGILLPPASLAPSAAGTLRIATVRANSNRYPARAETTTAFTIPQGTRRLGSIVSSAVWADAS